MPTFDERDQEILDNRIGAFNLSDGPRQGDYVRFKDGTVRRISHIWRDENREAFSVQTSDGGSYYLGDGFVSMSGSLYLGVKPETLTLTDETSPGSVWFFHHDWRAASNGVAAVLDFRVFNCSEDAKH